MSRKSSMEQQKEIMEKTEEKYRDIINLPHPVSKNHLQMSITDRAAQFAPFAALTGHGEVIKETDQLVEALMQEETEVWSED